LSEPQGDKSFERLLAAFLRDDLAPAGASCPPPGVAAAYYEGKLSPGELSDFERHVAGCAACQADVVALVRLEPGAQSAAEISAPRPVEVAAAPPPAEPVREPRPEAIRVEPLPTPTAPPSRDRLRGDEIREETTPPPARADDALDRAAELPKPSAMPFKPGPRRASWRWVAPVALAATVLLAVSVTLRFRPMVEESARMSRESEPLAPQSAPIGGGVERDHEEARREDKRAPADLFDQAAPLERFDQAPAPTQQPDPFSLKQGGFRAPPVPAAPAARPVPTAPAAAAGSATTSRAVEQTVPRAAELAKKEDATRAKAMERPAAPALAAAPKPEAARVERRATGAVIVIARTNLDAVWRLGGNGIERSDDAGKTFRPQMSFAAGALFTGSAPSAEICWVAGRGGVVLRTTDGEHWERISSPTEEDVVQITAWNASSATVKTGSGVRFSTNDGGKSWSQL
jgi:Putative zinc-finger